MCGIVGFVNRPGQQADRAIVERMTATLAHRGPDGDGIYCEGPAALGHRRLSIIDLAGGAQPMANEDNTIWLTYNGELYNEFELRKELLAKGHTYRTSCDTETLIHLYEEEGVNFARRLNGMFAAAIWDSRRGRLVLVRDRMGQKPLFYGELPGGGLAFGSEPKALLAHPAIGRTLDQASLARYLFYEYVPAPYSIWQSLRKLPRGHVLCWEDGKLQRLELLESRTNQLPSVSTSKPRPGNSGPSFATRSLATVAPMFPSAFFSPAESTPRASPRHSAKSSRPPSVHTFSIGFEDPSFDESHHARAVAHHLGTDHHEQTFSIDTVYQLLPKVASWLDEPFGDASILPTHLLSRFARNEVKVVLGGDGADELLAGYPTFLAERAAGVFRRLPRRPRPSPARPFESCPSTIATSALISRSSSFSEAPPSLCRWPTSAGWDRFPAPRSPNYWSAVTRSASRTSISAAPD